jgi:hypothetical protein
MHHARIIKPREMQPWSGGEQPVPDNVLVEVELRSGRISPPVWASEVH